MTEWLKGGLAVLAAACLLACSGARATDLTESVPAAQTGGDGGGGSNNGNGNGNGGGSTCPGGGVEQTSSSGSSPDQPTTFTTAACGTLAPGQVYWWTFTLPGGTQSFSFDYQGDIQIQGTVSGQTVTVTPTTPLPLHTRKPYLLQLTNQTSQAQAYTLTVNAH